MMRSSVILVLLISAASAGAAEEPAGIAFFEARVRPVLANHCYKCHSQQALDNKKLKGELFLDSRDGVLKGGENGAVLIPGKPQESKLLTAIRYTNPDLLMPPKDRLPDAVVADLEKWIAMGAPDPRTAAVPVAAPGKRTIDIAAARKYWAFQPLSKIDPPAAIGNHIARNAIDRFVLARLAAKGIGPNQPASRAVLIRRAYADLIGLPPTPQEVDAFVRDPAPDAWDRLVDKLLASDHYGERWARHWLDIVRFAESNGYEFDADRAGAYQYRDFVIRAFNRDMPYDEFVRWQIAGDKLLPKNFDAGAATGFLMAGPSPGQITAKTAEPLRYDQLDDMVSTLGSSMLAMTVGCCRCHDHKFDPLPQRDYYRMISCFAETDSAKLELDPKPAIYQQAEARWKIDNAPLAAAWEKYSREQMPPRALKLAKEASLDPASWLLVDFDRAESLELRSTEKKKLKKLDDGSVLLENRNRRGQTVTLVARTHLKRVSALRLEALADKELPKGGPGTGAAGEFVLSKMEIRATRLDGRGKPLDVKFKPFRTGESPLATQPDQTAPTLAVAPSADDESAKDKVAASRASANFFASNAIGTRSNFKGNLGFEFIAQTAIRVNALGRSVASGKLTRSHQIDIWDAATAESVADIIVTPASEVDKDGFAFERLAMPVALQKGHTYRITSGEEDGGDPFVDLSFVPSHIGVATVSGGAYSRGVGYPNQLKGETEQGYGVPTFYFDATGMAPALLKSAKASKSAGKPWASKTAAKDAAAVFDFEEPVGFDGGTELTITLKFDSGSAIGRPRVALTTQEDLAPGAPAQPQAMAELVALMDESKGDVNEKNRAEIERWMRSVDDVTATAYAALGAHEAIEPIEKFENVFGVAPRPGRPVYFLGRGEASKKNGLAPPGFLEILMTSPQADQRWTTQREGGSLPAPPTTAPSMRAKANVGPATRPVEPRVAMADWITDVDSGAGQLLARVIVNRLWQHHMGRGIVATPNDFGAQGESPTHPELLDFLARQLIANGWHLKPIQKMIMCSGVYMQSGDVPPEKAALDPENKLWWRHPPQRLDAEAVRDSLLAIAGKLDETMYGPGTLDEASDRRSVYLTVKRSKPILFLQLFDAPETMQSIGQRQVTTVATQALTLMNSPLVRQRAEELAARVRPNASTDLGNAIDGAYRLAFCRLPTDAERAAMEGFIDRQAKTYARDGTRSAFVDCCQILLCSDEFVYVD